MIGRRTRAAVAACATTAVLGVSAYALNASSPDEGNAGQAVGGTTSPFSQTSAQSAPPVASYAAAITASVDGTASPDIKSASVGLPPAGADQSGAWLYTGVTAESWNDGGGIHAAWLCNIVQGAIDARLDSAAGTGIIGSTISVTLSSGSVIQVAGGVTDPERRHATIPDVPDETENTRVYSIASEFGLHVRTITIHHPFGPAIDVAMVVPDVSLLKNRVDLLEQALLGSQIAAEGLYLQLEDSSGSLIARFSDAYRVGVGGSWIDPALDVPLGIGHG